MNDQTQYNVGGLHTRAQLLNQAAEHVKNLDPKTASEYLQILRTTLEFDMAQESLEKNRKHEDDKFKKRIMPTIGLCILLAFVVWAYFLPFPSRFQVGMAWAVMSLVAGIAAGLIPGFFEIENKTAMGLFRAGAGFAVFFLMYNYTPAVMSQKDVTHQDKVNIFVAKDDSLNINKISADFDPSKTTKISDFVHQTMKNYYGTSAAVDTFLCFRKSDGKLCGSDECSTLGEEDILAISNSLLRKYRDNRSAFLSISSRLQ